VAAGLDDSPAVDAQIPFGTPVEIAAQQRRGEIDLPVDGVVHIYLRCTVVRRTSHRDLLQLATGIYESLTAVSNRDGPKPLSGLGVRPPTVPESVTTESVDSAVVTVDG